ncbi:GldM family protein [Pontibacter sp. G13]|uniref:type IX secretion system motor protein PorM/GldM n=1 Tax=Pontibacter sp. G13 TaxID=3074898 RepID=UPI00288A54C3|nr:GldM family protein [Pontibacter sp. G13]WNJ16243.1 GldM family protein [Pontibacter sp. G13]
MAGGKLSPRQKMINMMYLVLLALLAMNVSAEILNAFENIKVKLQVSATNANDNSSAFMESMKAEIAEEIENEGKRTNEGLVDTLDQIKARTSAMIGIIDNHIRVLEDSISGRDEETNQILKKDETEKNLQYWMGIGKEQEKNEKRGNGQAFILHNQLDEYVGYLIKIYNENNKDPKQRKNPEEEYITDDPTETLGGQPKTWERYTFEGPLVANTATLEAMKLDVYEKEKELLDLLNTRLGVATFKADGVKALLAPAAEIVPAGLQYETKLFVVMTSSAMKPTWSASSGNVKEDESGDFSTLTIPANGRVIPKGKSEGIQKYSATVKVPKATGGFEEIPVEGSFKVRRPEIVVTSAAIQILYRNCGNDVNIDVPALGDQYNPVIAANGGSIIKSKSSKKKVRIVPTGKQCVVNVKSNTNGKTVDIGNITYKVVDPPKPSIVMYVNNKPYNGSQMIPKASRVSVRLEADPDFAAAMPQDANYGITSVDVLAQLALGPPTTVNSIRSKGKDATKGIAVNMGTKVRQARAGTKVYVRLNEIVRINFQKKPIPDKRFKEIERTLSLVVR